MVEQVYGQENSNLSYGIHSIILQCIKALSRWRSKQITTSQKVIQRLKQEIQDLKKNIGEQRVEYFGCKQGIKIQSTSTTKLDRDG
ncbi:unnamed protein product, partial [Brassica oleracea var. botrytis]